MAVTGFEKPKFRHEHLLAEAIDERGTRFVDVMDPDTGNAFRFFEVEFSIACGMNGERDVAGIVAWARDELGFAPSNNEVGSVIATLGELGYLDRVGDELAAGIVVPTAAAVAPAANVELGVAGAPMKSGVELPQAPDLQLGAPGAPRADTTPSADLDAPLVPAPQVSDVSLDLSEHMGVKPDDVKEAVRASKVMQAVEIPPELQDALDAPDADAPSIVTVVDKPTERPTVVEPLSAAERLAAKPVDKPVEKPAVVDKPVEKPAVVEKPAIVAKPVEKLVEKTPIIEKPAEPTPTPGRRVSPVLVVVLILAVGAAAAYFVWKYVISKSNTTTTGSTEPAPTPTPPPPPPPAKPDPVTFAVETPAPIEVKATANVALESIEAVDTVVKKDAVVAKLVGNRPAAADLAIAQRELDRVQHDVDNLMRDIAAAQGNAGRLKVYEARLAERNNSKSRKLDTVAKKTAALDKFLVKAPVDGTLKSAAKPGALKADELVFTIAPAAIVVATFKSAEVKPDSNVLVAVKDKADKLTCHVVSVDDSGTKVACHTPDAASLEGAEVTLAGPAPDTEDGPTDIESGDPDKTDGEKPAEPEKPTEKTSPESTEKTSTEKPTEKKPTEASPKPADEPKPDSESATDGSAN